MALMKLSTFQKTFHEGDAPDSRTVISWIEKGTIFGQIYSQKSIYVDPDKPAPISLMETASANDGEIPDNPLIHKVLNNLGATNSDE